MALQVFHRRRAGIAEFDTIVEFNWEGEGVYGNDSEQTGARVTGLLYRVVTNPDDTDVPNANWDLTITDEDGVDLLAGQGVNRSNSNSEQIVLSNPVEVSSKLTFSVTNGGTGKKGKVTAYLR
jgi:hypothetical protein